MISAVLFDGDADSILELHKKLGDQDKVDIVNTTRDLPELESILKKTGVDVVILGPSLKNKDMAWVGETISAEFPHVAIILISKKLNTDLLRDALKAGVKDVLPASATGEQLLQTVEIAFEQSQRFYKAVQDREEKGPTSEIDKGNRAKTITFFGPKGGVGTTFIATNVGVSLAEQTKKPVVLLDLDFQFGDVAVMLRVQPVHTVHDVVTALDRLDEEMMNGFLATHAKSGVKALVAPVQPEKADAIRSNDVLKIITVLQGICDYLVIDTPSYLDDRILAAFDKSDEICLVTSLDVPSLKNTKLALNMIELLHYSEKPVQLLLNRAKSNVRLNHKDVAKTLGKKPVAHIPSDVIVPVSLNKGIPVVIDAPKAQVTRQLLNLANTIRNGNQATTSEVQSAKKKSVMNLWRGEK